MDNIPQKYGFAHLIKQENFIAGKWFDAGAKRATVTDKYQGSPIGEVPLATKGQVELAVDASAKAAREFAGWSLAKRKSHLKKVLELFSGQMDAFAHLIASEAGKPLSYAKGEVRRCQSTLELAIEEVSQFTGEVVQVDYDAGVGRRAYTKRVPRGPILCISPFNFPLNLALHKLAPALAIGCPVILKPALQTPFSALAFAAICEAAGYPPGFISVFLCSNELAESMVRDDRLKLLSFTGSDQVGWHLKAVAGKKPVILELGGNAATIVDETADLDHVAQRLAIGSFLYSGQICISTQRIVMVESIAAELTAKIIEASQKLKVGDPFDPEVTVGPVIASVHLERLSEWVAEAVELGAEVLLGGKIADKNHNLFPPTLLAKVPDHLRIVREEAFGPVAIVQIARDFQHAIELANNSKYGLQAGVFTNRIDRMKAAHDQLEVGGVIVNDVPGFRVDGMPYGGVKDSGLGREGLRYALEDYTEPRLLVW